MALAASSSSVKEESFHRVEEGPVPPSRSGVTRCQAKCLSLLQSLHSFRARELRRRRDQGQDLSSHRLSSSVRSPSLQDSDLRRGQDHGSTRERPHAHRHKVFGGAAQRLEDYTSLLFSLLLTSVLPWKTRRNSRAEPKSCSISYLEAEGGGIHKELLRHQSPQPGGDALRVPSGSGGGGEAGQGSADREETLRLRPDRTGFPPSSGLWLLVLGSGGRRAETREGAER